MQALQTDLYQLTMAAGYWKAGKSSEVATFELFVRRLPPRRHYLIFAGLPQIVEYLHELRFHRREIEYLQSLEVLRNAPPGFFDYLEAFRFTGSVRAMAEGTPFFAGEPVLAVRAPLIEAQLVETYLLAMIGFQSMIASKAMLVARAAGDRAVVEFGTRRAHSPEAGVLAARAAYIGGCAGTSNAEAGFRYGIPVFGTSAHSWVTAFAHEVRAFAAMRDLLGERAVHLIDSYNTLLGARKAAALGRPLWGVRLDSGDLEELSRHVRRILDEAGLSDARIMASGDLNEDRIGELCRAGAPINVFGVGTELSTSADAPNVAAVYKMVELERAGAKRYTAKYSPEKGTLPGSKQVYRHETHDEVACEGEPPRAGATPLLRPVVVDGELAEPLPGVAEARALCGRLACGMQPGRGVVYSDELMRVAAEHRGGPA